MAPHIAIVEDDEHLALLLRYNLEAHGCAVEWFSRGLDADQRLQQGPYPDLLVLDWMLPELAGIEILRRLRSRAETRRIPVVMLTALTEDRHRIRALQTGASDFICKPFSLATLMSRIQSLLAGAAEFERT